MTDVPALLVAASAGIVLALGTLHLVLTFHGDKLHPRDAALIATMQATSPVLTRRTTMWKTWIGFNASHSLGAMLFGLVYGYLALRLPGVLFASFFLQLTGLAVLTSYVAIGWRYWFRAPLRGAVAATLLYVAGLALAAF